uniref:DNA binding protein VP5 n=1 Tax=Gokushovirinae environmental samples TaxID=1478972 RepID=A0A2R3UAG5_9VIRU|nr:DNA binding protein VP5 [Gokushovirinae environmental samples]
MKLVCFSVRDEKIGAFLPPFTCRARGEALRSFTDAVNNPEHLFAKNLEDYVLYEVGFFEDVAGMFAPKEPERLLSGFEAKTPQ